MSGIENRQYELLEQIERLKEFLKHAQWEIERLEEENSMLKEELEEYEIVIEDEFLN